MATFNVLFEPWIQVKDKQGKTVELGILDVLEKAPDLTEISEPSPLMRYGIYRLLIAFLTDALRPEIEEDLADLMADGRFPMERIRQYVRECEKDGPCFDLFDEKKPFLQSSFRKDWEEKNIGSICKLLYELPSGENTIHFQHTLESGYAISPVICVRALCAINIFAGQGGRGYYKGINGDPPWYVIISAENLFKTLIYSIWIPSGIEIPIYDLTSIWSNVKDNYQLTYVRGLVWPARNIKLILSQESGICSYSGEFSNNLIKKMYFSPGLVPKEADLWRDPHVAYVYRKDFRFPAKPSEGRAAWRDLGSIIFSRMDALNTKDEKAICPAIIEQYNRLKINGYLNEDNSLRLEIFGVATNKASLEGWQHDRFNIDWKAVSDDRKAAWLNEALLMTEETNKVLRKALHRIPPQHGKKKINQKWFCDELIEQAEMSFFAIMRQHFFEKLIPLVAKTDTEEYHWRDKLNGFWMETLQKEARKVFNQIVDGIGLGAKNLERRVAAEKSLSWSFYDLRKGVSNE